MINFKVKKLCCFEIFTSMSLENRFITLPRGVVSKKDIGDLKIEASIPAWRRFAATTILIQYIILWITRNMTAKNKKKGLDIKRLFSNIYSKQEIICKKRNVFLSHAIDEKCKLAISTYYTEYILHVCICVCMYICMYVCMYVCILQEIKRLKPSF